MGFNSAFKGLSLLAYYNSKLILEELVILIQLFETELDPSQEQREN